MMRRETLAARQERLRLRSKAQQAKPPKFTRAQFPTLTEREGDLLLAKHAPYWRDHLFDDGVIDRILHGISSCRFINSRGFTAMTERESNA